MTRCAAAPSAHTAREGLSPASRRPLYPFHIGSNSPSRGGGALGRGSELHPTGEASSPGRDCEATELQPRPLMESKAVLAGEGLEEDPRDGGPRQVPKDEQHAAKRWC